MGIPNEISIFNELFLIDMDFEDAERATVAYIANDHTELGRIVAGVVERNLKKKEERYAQRAVEMAGAVFGMLPVVPK